MKLSNEEIRTITEQEEELWIEESRFDIKRMREILAEDFEEVGQSGRYYALADTLAIERSQFETRLPLIEYNLKLLSHGVVLATYISEVKYGSTVVTARRSSIWCKSHDKWQLKYHQGTPV